MYNIISTENYAGKITGRGECAMMKKDTLMNTLKLEYPDSFDKMEQNELKKYYSTVTNRWGIIYRDQHMIISVGWTNEIGFFGSLFVDEKTLLSGFDKRGRNVLKSYKRTDDIDKTVCGNDARGFAFEYEATDTSVPMFGKIVAFKTGKRIWLAEYSTSNTDTLFCNMAFDMVLDSIRAVGA